MISSTPEPNPATRSSDHSRFYRRLSHLHESQTKNPPHPRRSRRLKLLFRAAGLLLLFLVVCILVFAFSLRRSMRAALPQLDGSITVAGLSAPVTITRDPQGVPSITAANLDDLLFSQGYITASDRLFQMDALRRHAAGTLAEILGPNLVSHDRYQRTLQISAAADRALATLPPDQLHQLSAYAAGVNAFIASHSSTLPVEFHLLRYTPAPWSPRDTLLVVLAMAQDLSTEFPQKLNREELSTHLPANLLPDLYPSGSWRDIPPGDPGPDLTGTKDAIPQIPLDKSQSRLNQPRLNLPSATPANLLSVFTALSHANCDNCRSGSNNWAVSATHSATGGPLLSNDMHLGLMVPSTWYEASLHTNATGPTASPLNVTGFTLPGVPFVIVGRNAHVAWGFTAALADVQDVRIEHLRGSGNDQQFELPNGSWAPVQHHLETIHVRFGLDKTLDVLTTTHTVGSAAAGSISTIQTPLINPIYPTEHRALSLAWNIYDPATIAIPGLAIDSATNGASLVAAFATFGTPALNLVYADDANHIGYHLIGRIPVRGPAIQRPRATPQFILPDANPDDDDQNPDDPNQTNPDNPSDNTPTSPNASLTLPFASAQLLSAAYVRPSHHARPAHTSHPRRAAAKPKLPIAPKKSIPTTPSPDQQTLAPAPATLYTIGSPISPIPVDSLDASQAWSGFIPYAELPSSIDPASGILATANARVTTDNYPYFIANDWVDPYRLDRIHHQLSTASSLTPSDLLALQNDTHSELDLLVAQRTAYALDRTAASRNAKSPDAKRLHQAADILRSWDGNLSANSTAGAIATATRSELWPILLSAQLSAHDRATSGHHRDPADLIPLYTWNERTFALEQLLEHTPARWLPPNFHSWDDLLTFAVDQALQRLHAPSDLTRLTYGAIHPVEIAHPIFGSHTVLSQLLGVPTGTGFHPIGGDNTTIKQTGLHFGPSERFTADLAHPESTLANITTGQSGNPASPWYLDQFLPWLNGTTFPLPLNYPRSTHTLTLTP
jgi:penicillin amidase